MDNRYLKFKKFFESYLDKDGDLKDFHFYDKENLSNGDILKMDDGDFKDVVEEYFSNDMFLNNDIILKLSENKIDIYFRSLIDNNMWLVDDSETITEYLHQILAAIEMFPIEFKSSYQKYLMENLKDKSGFDFEDLKIFQDLDTEYKKMFVDVVLKYANNPFYISENDLEKFDKLKDVIEAMRNKIKIY